VWWWERYLLSGEKVELRYKEFAKYVLRKLRSNDSLEEAGSIEEKTEDSA
jgi:hypothetical protein